jgi:hypothetical protein
MKLTSLISILFSTRSNDGYWKFLFKDQTELESEISNIHKSFADSDETLSDPKAICDWILKHMTIEIYRSDLSIINENPNFMYGYIKETNPELFGRLCKMMIDNKQRELDKDGSKYIVLNKDEFYALFSRSTLRDKKLKIIHNK